MSELVDWLLEQIAEDERVARDAALNVGWRGFGDERIDSGKHWAARYHVVVRKRSEDSPAEKRGVADCGSLELSTARHIAAFDPARVLAECEAKRRRIKLLAQLDKLGLGIPRGTASLVFEDWRREMLHTEALPYADRPGFREEWRS